MYWATFCMIKDSLLIRGLQESGDNEPLESLMLPNDYFSAYIT
jgi:hypothetical protein